MTLGKSFFSWWNLILSNIGIAITIVLVWVPRRAKLRQEHGGRCLILNMIPESGNEERSGEKEGKATWKYVSMIEMWAPGARFHYDFLKRVYRNASQNCSPYDMRLQHLYTNSRSTLVEGGWPWDVNLPTFLLCICSAGWVPTLNIRDDLEVQCTVGWGRRCKGINPSCPECPLQKQLK